MVWAPLSNGSSLRNRRISSSTATGTTPGDDRGRRDRSTNPAGPSAIQRRRYL